MVDSADPKIAIIRNFFAAYTASDLEGMRSALSEGIEWIIPGHHILSGAKRGVEEVAAFFDQLAKAGFRADPLFLEANEEYVVDIHRGWTTEGVGEVDTLWALVWHFDTDGKVDRVINLSGDQHQMDMYIWANYQLARIPERLA